MFDNNHFLPEEWIERREPVDDIEPDIKRSEAIHDARVRGIRLLNAMGTHIQDALLRPSSTIVDVAVAFYQAAYAFGLAVCDGKSMTERAEMWGVERASISKGATALCSLTEMPPSFYMKKETAQGSYRDARINSIRKCQTPNFKAA